MNKTATHKEAATIDEKVAKRIEQDLTLALVYFAKGKLNPNDARKMTAEVLAKVDIDNPVVAHKGINRLAKEVLERKQLI